MSPRPWQRGEGRTTPRGNHSSVRLANPTITHTPPPRHRSRRPVAEERVVGAPKSRAAAARRGSSIRRCESAWLGGLHGGCFLLRMLAWGELWETARLGRPRRREPTIDSPNASRAEKASKSQESRRCAASFPSARGAPVHAPAFQPGFHPCGCGRRTASASIGRWVVCVFSQPKYSMARMDHGSHHDDGHVRVPLTWAPFPSVAKHVSWTASNPTRRRRHFTSAGPARRYAWRTRPQPFNKNAALQPGGSPTADHRPRRKRRPPTRSAAARGMAGCSTPSRYHCLGSWEWEWEWWADHPHL